MTLALQPLLLINNTFWIYTNTLQHPLCMIAFYLILLTNGSLIEEHIAETQLKIPGVDLHRKIVHCGAKRTNRGMVNKT